MCCDVGIGAVVQAIVFGYRCFGASITNVLSMGIHFKDLDRSSVWAS